MNLQETYNKIAKDWQNDHQDDTWWQEGTNHFISLLNPGDEVLDVGCGTGVKAGYLSDRGLRVTGIDFSEGMIKVARNKHPEINFMILDIKNIQQLDRTFDAIFAQASLLHISKAEVQEVVKGFVTHLKLNGYLYVAVKEKREGGVDEEVKKENDYGYDYERFFSYFTPEEAAILMQNAGLEVVYQKVECSGNTNWIQIIGHK
ncbi:MAG: class I SAM-dependent methyltransferase [Anaplasmataceae bacterium]|nr:class I SAM-dependent methyltransferase [Anaplasmataceae bacterium]